MSTCGPVRGLGEAAKFSEAHATLPEEPASGSDGVDAREGVDSAFAEPAGLDEARGELPADHARGARNQNMHGADTVGPQRSIGAKPGDGIRVEFDFIGRKRPLQTIKGVGMFRCGDKALGVEHREPAQSPGVQIYAARFSH